MKILVTGGNGFIGQHVVRELLDRKQRGHEVGQIVVMTHRLSDRCTNPDVAYSECDIRDEDEVASSLAIHQPDIIFHLAANPVVRENFNNPCDLGQLNIMGTHHLLAHCKPGVKFAFASSATVYGPGRIPGGGAHYSSEFDLTNPSSVYAATKIASEELINVYGKLGNIKPMIFRLIANVGAGATHGVLPAILKKLRSDATTLTLLGEKPGSIKPFAHVKDTAKFMVDATLQMTDSDVVNVTATDSISVEEVANLTMNALGIHKPLEWLGAGSTWAGDDKEVYIKSVRAARMGYLPKHVDSRSALIQAIKDQR